jgi:hypothetical protein
MAYMDDSLIRANLNAIAVAADSAALSGIPLEEQTYQTVATKEVGRFPSIENPNGGVIYEFTTGDRVAISDVLISDEHSDKLRSRAARCAYVCGKSSIEGTCALKLAENDETDESYDDLMLD